jgi:hypothetical protein
MDPVVDAVPVTVIVTELSIPAFSCTAVNEIALPVPDAVPHAAVPADSHVHVTSVRFDGTASATVAPDTSDGPSLVTTNVYVAVASCTTVAGPVLTIARSAAGVIVVVTDAVSLLVSPTSVVPSGGATVAVFVNSPVLDAVPLTVIVTLLPIPALTSTSASDIAFPVPVALVPGKVTSQFATPFARQVHDTPVMFAGTTSVIVAPRTLDGPAFVTTNVYITASPCTTDAGPVLVIARSAAGVIVESTVAALLPGIGSVVPKGVATIAVFANAPVAVAVPVTVTVTEFAGPALSCTSASEIAFPLPDAAPHAAVPTATHVHDTAVRFGGTESTIVAPDTSDRPLFVAVNV